MTLKELIARKRNELAGLSTERAENVTALAELRGNEELTEADEARIEELRTRNGEIDTRANALEVEISDLEAEQARDDAADARTAVTHDTGAPDPAEGRAAAVVTSEPRQYTRESDPRGAQFERDVAAAFLGNFEARGRLERHMAEERVERGAELTRAGSTSNFAGLTVPQYLVDLYGPHAKAGRPFADACRQHELPPDGMTIHLSRITTGSDVGPQSTQNSAVDEQDVDDTEMTLNVKTNAGQQTLSRQAIERGSGVEAIVIDDLFRKYATSLDSQLINDGTTGLSATSSSITYSPTTPSAANLYPKVLEALSDMEGALLDQSSGESLAVMHSRRWYWLQSEVSNESPFIGQPRLSPEQGGKAYASAYGSGFRGLLPNSTAVIVDNNVPTNLGSGTNEDEIYLVDPTECHLWEDSSAPLFIRAEQPKAASLGVLLVVYGYFAYTFDRQPHTQKVAGDGLVTPTF